MEDGMLEGKEDKELLKEKDGAGAEEKVKVDAGEEDAEVAVGAVGVGIEPKEYEKGLEVDDAENKLVVAGIEELGFDEKFKEGKVGLASEDEVKEEPKEKDGVWLADAAGAGAGGDRNKGVAAGAVAAAEEKREEENGEEVEEREKGKEGDCEEDEEEVEEGLKENGDAIGIQDGLLPL